jgi:hypothetical protein
MKSFALSLVVSAFVSASALAQTTIVNQAAVAKVGGIPQFLVDSSWPKPLPNNWLLGQASGIRVDRFDSAGNIYTAEVATGERVQRFRRIDLPN